MSPSRRQHRPTRSALVAALAAALALSSSTACGKKKRQPPPPATEQPASGESSLGGASVLPSDPLDQHLSALPTELLATASEILVYQPTGVTDQDHLRVAELIARTSALRNAVMQRHGVPYQQIAYAPPADALGRDNVYGEFLDFQSAHQRQLAGAFAADPTHVRMLADALVRDRIITELTRRADAAVALVRSQPNGDGPTNKAASPPRVIYLDRGTELDSACQQTMRAALVSISGSATTSTTATVITVAGVPGLDALLGTMAQCVAIVDGRLGTQMATEAQWREALGVPQIFGSDWPSFSDAHLHLMAGAESQREALLSLTGAKSTVVMGLPIGERWAEIEQINADLLRAAAGDPRLIPLAVLDPQRADLIGEFESALAKGARGIKLLSGHGDLWLARGQLPLDPPALDQVMNACAKAKVPVLWHVNAHLLGAGALALIARHRDVNFILPHFAGYLTFAPAEVALLLRDNPNLYIDLSIGSQPWYMHRVLVDLSMNAAAWRELLERHPTRFLFAVDLVIQPETSLAHAISQTELHLSVLLKARYQADIVPVSGMGTLADLGHHLSELNGLALSPKTATRILGENARALGLAR